MPNPPRSGDRLDDGHMTRGTRSPIYGELRLSVLLLKVVSHDDLSVLSISLMCFTKKIDRELGGWGVLYSFFGGIYLTLQIPLHRM